MFNVSERTIQSVKAVEREAPELIPEIEKGKIHRQGESGALSEPWRFKMA